MSLKLTWWKQFVNLIHSVHLPWVTVGVGVIIEPSEENEALAGRYLLLVKRYGVLDSTYK